MSLRARGGAALATAVAILLATPAAASAHAYLTHTSPLPNAVLASSPRRVALTYDEAVEPRFAIISVTDAAGHQLTTAPVSRSPSNPDTLFVPLKPHLPRGWYLIYWRAISVDGHPVQGAYTFAVGPEPGPPPQFAIPNISETATTPNLLAARWIMFLSVMVSIGLFAFRMLIARPLMARVEETNLRPVTIAFCVMAAVGMVAIPTYLDIATSIDSLRSPFAVGELVPLFRVTAFGRAYVDMEICYVLFVAAAALALWVDRPLRRQRSIAELLSVTGALVGAAAVLLVPGLAGHAAQTAPRGLSLLLDWCHLISGSIWLGGLVGLLVVWATLPAGRRVAGLGVCVPRFSNVALASVLVLLATGVGATIIHIPILAALWQTSYGIAILVKIGLLSAAMLLGAVNLLRSKPRLVAATAQPGLGEPAARLLRRTVSGEVILASSAVLAAAILSSLAPPSSALAQLDSALATVGPSRVASTVTHNGYTFRVLVNPNKVAQENSFALQITKHGQPVTGADVTLTFEMLDMQMQNQEYQMKEIRPGVYSHSAPALVMTGRWGLAFNITPRGGSPFTAFIVDHAAG
jgi:copper transport protein